MILPNRWIFVGPTARWLVVLSALLVADRAPADGPLPGIGQDPLAERYSLGHGVKLGDTGFTLGGYGDASYRDVNDGEAAALSIDEISTLLSWDGGGRLHFFAETKVEDLLVLQRGHSDGDDAELVSERLYFDWVWNDEVKVRVGKFLTPIGRWNLIHAAPLTWTTTRPLITEATFPTNATGLMIYGTLPWLADGVEYSAYGSIGEELFPAHELDTFSEALGMRLAATLLPHTQFGLSLATFEQESSTDVRKQLVGIDFAWTWHRWEFSGEFADRVLRKSSDVSDEQGLYLQLVAPLSVHWYGVGRFERFYPQDTDDDFDLYLVGINYKPIPPLIFKAEYNHAAHNGPDVSDGFRASVAVLF